MPITVQEKFLAYLALFSGLVISVVAEYYSILGLTAIFAAAVVPVIIMGIALGVGKISATLWLKQNWNISPWTIRIYLAVAVAILMLITSMGIFGFLSKAHSDQNLVGGDVLAKISVFDEKIKISKENIDANRKALKQLDESVDQVMGRSTDEKGADKAVALRRSQGKERTRLIAEIEAEQKTISRLNEEAAPIRAEVRRVEAEVGPIKYIAAFVYGDTEQTVLEKAVTWVIIILIVVFDPLAVVLLLASQYSFQNFRTRRLEEDTNNNEIKTYDKLGVEEPVPKEVVDNTSTATVVDFPETKHKFTAEELKALFPEFAEQQQEDTLQPLSNINTHSYLKTGFAYPQGFERTLPMVGDTPTPVQSEPVARTKITGNRAIPRTKIFKAAPKTFTSITEDIVQGQLEEEKHTITNLRNGYVQVDGQIYNEKSLPPRVHGYVQNEEQQESNKWSSVNKNEG